MSQPHGQGRVFSSDSNNLFPQADARGLCPQLARGGPQLLAKREEPGAGAAKQGHRAGRPDIRACRGDQPRVGRGSGDAVRQDPTSALVWS